MSMTRSSLRTAILAGVVLSASSVTFGTRAARAADSPAAAQVEEARTRARRHDARGAIAALEKALAADPGDPDAHILYQDMGRDAIGIEKLQTIYRQRRDERADDPLYAFLYARLLPPEQALPEFDRQIVKFAQSPWPHVGRAHALDGLGRAAEAGPEYDQAVLLGPREIRFKVFQAYGLERAGNWSAAVEQWKLILVTIPKDRGARMGLGESQRKTGAFEDALATFGDLVKADAADAEARHRVGLTYLDAGRLDDALMALDAAIQSDKLFAEAYCAATEAAIKKAMDTAEKEKRYPTAKDFERAINYGAKAAAVAPDSAAAHGCHAAAQEAAGEDDAAHLDVAAAAYDSALNLLPLPTPEKVRTLCGKAYVQLRMGRYDVAVATAEKAIEIDPRCAAAFSHAGHALAAQGRQDDAIKKYYRPGLKVAPDDARLHHGLGVALWETKHEVDAKKELEAAVKADPENPRYRLTLGELYYTLKQYKPSVEMLNKVVDARPGDPLGWNCYGRAVSAMKLWSEAAEAFEKVCTLLDGKATVPQDPAAPAGGNPAPPAGSAEEPVTDSGVLDSLQAHLYLAIIYADHLKLRDKAKAHAKKYREMNGSDPNLQSWLDDLLSGD